MGCLHLLSNNLREYGLHLFLVSLSVLKFERKTVIIGSTVKIRWDISQLSFPWFIFLYQSTPHLSLFKRYTWISSIGESEVVVSAKYYRCELRQLTFLGWKTREKYIPEVRDVAVLPKKTTISSPAANFDFLRLKNLSGSAVKFRENSMNIRIPNVKVFVPIDTEPTNY
jgi:hypothetical protein